MYGVGSWQSLAVGLCIFYTFKVKDTVQLQQAEDTPKRTDKKIRPSPLNALKRRSTPIINEYFQT